MTDCVSSKKALMAIHDSMDVLGGKWKISMLTSICYFDERRFSDIVNDLHGISNKQLSKELKDLEQNKLITRTVKRPSSMGIPSGRSPGSSGRMPIMAR